MGSLAANLLGVLIAGILLGVEVWVAGIVGLAHVVSQQAITPGLFAEVGMVLGTSAIGYVAVVVLIRTLLG